MFGAVFTVETTLLHYPLGLIETSQQGWKKIKADQPSPGQLS